MAITGCILIRTWPVFVIVAGLILIWRAYQAPTEGKGGLAPHLNVFAVWGGGEYRIRAKDFRGGQWSPSWAALILT